MHSNLEAWNTLHKIEQHFREQSYQGSHRNLKTQFHDFSMIFHDQQCNFHDYLMHRLKPPLLAATSPSWA